MFRWVNMLHTQNVKCLVLFSRWFLCMTMWPPRVKLGESCEGCVAWPTTSWCTVWPRWVLQGKPRESKIGFAALSCAVLPHFSSSPSQEPGVAWGSCCPSFPGKHQRGNLGLMLPGATGQSALCTHKCFLELWLRTTNRSLIVLTYLPQPYVGVKIPVDKIKCCLGLGPT